MLEHTSDYSSAITADARLIFIRAIVDLSDPDKKFLPVTASPEAPWSKKEELHDYELTPPPRISTMEHGRTLLNGDFDLFDTDYFISSSSGYVSEVLSGPDGTFANPVWVQLNFEDVDVLQAFSLFFSSDPLDGVPEDFTVEVIQGNTSYFTETVTGNHKTEIQFKGFTVYNPGAIRVTFQKWTLPSRRVRLVEIVMGIFERWSTDMLEGFSVTNQAQFSCLTLPYGTAEITMDNSDRRFEPRRKDSMFQSIEARQGIDIYIGVRLENGMDDYKRVGTFYQSGDGWKTSSNAPTMKWSLVDLIGLVAERTFLPPKKENGEYKPLPTTLDGWIKAVVMQLGDSFAKRYSVDPDYANKPVTALSREDVTDVKCGDIIRWACMAAGVWPRADQETGRITAEPLWNQGTKITLDNLNDYPTMKANESLAALIFQLANPKTTTDPETGETTTQKTQEFVVSGNSTTSEKTVTIVNPFIHTTEQALAAAKLILAQYGGNILELTGRGNPSSEIGDVDTVWLDESNATTARRMLQTFQIQSGVLQGCRSTLLQADGSYLWEGFEVIRESGKWKAPPGVRQLRVVIGRGGQGGGRGQEGQYGSAGSSNISFSGYTTSYGDQGVDGQGGEIWYGVIPCNEEQEFDVYLGAGGAPGTTYGKAGALGEHSTFGPYTSENGTLYPNGYTDIANGQAFARPGVAAPLPGTGDGGAGGAGGDPPEGYLDWVPMTYLPSNPDMSQHPGTQITGHYTWKETRPAGPGHPGAQGATGFVMVTWDKPDDGEEAG